MDLRPKSGCLLFKLQNRNPGKGYGTPIESGFLA